MRVSQLVMPVGATDSGKTFYGNTERDSTV